MDLIQNTSDNINLIETVSHDSVKLSGKVYHESVIVTHRDIYTELKLQHVNDLHTDHIQILLQSNPEVILFGSGVSHLFPNPELLTDIAKKDVGFEVMTNQAAARTYNIMLAEERKVSCLLIIEK